MANKYDAIIVGAGPAGSAAAITLAKGGAKVLMLERGDFPGAKNVSGAGLYDISVINELLPEFYSEAPYERIITKKVLGFMTETQLMTVNFQDQHKAEPPYTGFTVLRPKLDRWLADKAVAKGARLLNKTVVTGIHKIDSQVQGVVTEDGSIIQAPIVIAADGVNSFIAKSLQMQKTFLPEQMSLGVKEIISLPKDVLENRFNIRGNEGVACEMVGYCSNGVNGGGFLYTNQDSVSIGIVGQVSSLMAAKVEPYTLLRDFKAHVGIAPLLAGGTVREYSAHLIPEGGYSHLSKLSASGVMVVGDAAGFVLVTGYLLLGINYALESGMAAGKAALAAIQKQDYSAQAMQAYEQNLEACGLLPTFRKFKHAPEKVVNNYNIQNKYADFICSFMGQLYDPTTHPIPKILPMAKKAMRDADVGLGDLAKDVLKIGGTLGW